MAKGKKVAKGKVKKPKPKPYKPMMQSVERRSDNSLTSYFIIWHLLNLLNTLENGHKTRVIWLQIYTLANASWASAIWNMVTEIPSIHTPYHNPKQK